jgi:hypothetical protein
MGHPYADGLQKIREFYRNEKPSEFPTSAIPGNVHHRSTSMVAFGIDFQVFLLIKSNRPSNGPKLFKGATLNFEPIKQFLKAHLVDFMSAKDI